MIKVLCTSYLAPTAKSGVTTHYKKLAAWFDGNDKIAIQVVTIADAPKGAKMLAGFLRRAICLLSFGNKSQIRRAFEIKNQVLIYFALWKYRNQTFDIIHAQDILSGTTAADFFKHKIPLVLTCHFNDNPVEEDLVNYNIPEIYRDKLIKEYTHKFNLVNEFIFVSHYAFQKSSFLLNKNAAVKIIPNGVDFSDKNNQQKKYKQTNALPFTIVNAGYIDARKNQVVLINIAHQLIKKGFSNFRIILVGDGPDSARIKEIVSEQNLGGYFQFTGWQQNADAIKYIKDADLYIHTAANDNCPYSVIEAIACNIPVIGFNVGGMPEILDQQWLFALNDAEATASFIINNWLKMDEIAAAQYGAIKDTFSLQVQFENITSVYENLMLPSYKNGNAQARSNYSMQTS